MRKYFSGIKPILIIFLFILSQHFVSAQVKKPVPPDKAGKKYGSLLWEITGNGLKKPSYLFGTMHISDKLAFHLGDSFYNAIKAVDMVALESNPDEWQDNYSESVFLKDRNRYSSIFFSSDWGANDKMSISSFSIDDYEEALKAALAIEPSLVNGLLYRTYGNRMADFEEDTYLDMHIFQTGKKLGKRLAGVENFKESEKLVLEAYRDMIKDDKKKKRSFDLEGMFANPKRMEEAYRKGDLDALDSLDAMEVVSDAFQEKFLYRRNDIQAKNMDSLMKTTSLFTAVGAAHLPGKRGVIEILRRMGYTLRPIKMDDRNSRQKESLEKARFATSFLSQKSGDNFYDVSIPGKKFYTFTEWAGLDTRQFADMANGSYYMVTRVKTNSHFQGQGNDAVYKKIDSLLYENIPGKILKKTPITRNGYKGWEIQNRIRRGDHQRYNIYVTPFEIIVFKMSGNGDYVNAGNEAQQFFSSVKLKEYKEGPLNNFQPATGGFSVKMPYAPSLLRDDHTGTDRLEYAAHDQQNSYLIIQSNFANFSFVEEDSFELKLMDESYAFSGFIDKKISQRFFTQDKYPGLEVKYKHKDGSSSTVKFMIRGALYYTAAVRYMNENENAKSFIESFSLKPFIYPEAKQRTDTSLHFSVLTSFFPDDEKESEEEKMLDVIQLYQYGGDDDEETDRWSDNNKFKIFGNDTLGERIFVSFQKPGNYTYIRDTASFWKNNFSDDSDYDYETDSSFIYKVDKRYELPGGIKIRELQITDTASSRLILAKHIYKDGYVYSLMSLTDTLNTSPFLSKFFSSFTPADTLKGASLFTRKAEKFFTDYFSTDSVTAKKARKSLYNISFDSADVPLLKQAIERINRKTYEYPDVKKHLITKLGDIKDSTIVSFLSQQYIKVKDTADFQNAILDALLAQRTKGSFDAFKTLILQETPVEPGSSSGSYYPYNKRRPIRIMYDYHYTSGYGGGYGSNFFGPWHEMYDTLQLTKTMFPDILQLMNIEDYKELVINLVVTMVDSGHLKASDYDSWFTKINLDAKQLLKKQIAKEDADNLEKENRKDKRYGYYGYDEDEEQEMEYGNSDLENYAVLMMPFYEKNPSVPGFFGQLIKTRDRELFYKTCLLLLRNKKPVPDSFFTKYAGLDKYRSTLYKDLTELKMTDKFPAAYKTQEQITRSMLLADRSYYDKPDSLTYIDKLPVTWKDKKGWVYFFKYKDERDDNFWNLCAIGMQPEKQDSISADNEDFGYKEGQKIKNDQPLKEQMEKMLQEMLNTKRASASEFYDARRYNLYKNYLSDIVKKDRFSD